MCGCNAKNVSIPAPTPLSIRLANQPKSSPNNNNSTSGEVFALRLQEKLSQLKKK